MEEENELWYFDEYGILRFQLGAKILILLLAEISLIWLSFILLSYWKFFTKTDYGKVIISFNIIFL